MQNTTARGIAMGSAFTSLANGTAALMYNPAGLGQMEFLEISLHHNSAPGDLLQETIIAGMPAGDAGNFAVAFNFSDNGIFEVRDDYGVLSDAVNRAGEMGLNICWGKEWAPGFFAGISAKAGRKNLADREYFFYGGDAGLLWKPLLNVALGAAFLNMGGRLGGDLAASGVSAGASWGFDIFKHKTLLLAASATSQINGPSRVNAGIEFSGNDMPSFRAGYIHDFSGQRTGGIAGITAGMGFKINSMFFDYAFVPAGDLGYSHRVSLTYVTSMKAPERQYLPKSDPRVISFETVYFDHEQSELTREAREKLKKNILLLQANNATEVRIAAYASKSGSRLYNMKLSEKRAIAIRNFLIREGDIYRDRVFIIWHGDNDPAVYETDPEDRNSEAAKLNRRGLFQVIKN